MSIKQRSRLLVVGSAVVLGLTLLAPVAVTAEEDVAALALAAAPAEEDTRGSGSPEASRVIAAQQALQSPDLCSLQEEALMAVVAAAMTWDETSGYGSVEASRAGIAMDVRWAPARAIMDQALAFRAAAAVAWDDTSGYGAVEASRAANALPAPPASFTSQVSPDVRWAPAPAIAPVPEDDMGAVVAAAIAWDETSGYGAVETTRAETAEYGAPAAATTDEAALLAQFRAVELALSRDLGAEHAEQLAVSSCHGVD